VNAGVAKKADEFEVELAHYQSLYYQICFCHAKSAAAFKSQTHSAEALLSQVFEQQREQELQLAKQQQQQRQQLEVMKLQQMLQVQQSGLEKLFSQDDAGGNYPSFVGEHEAVIDQLRHVSHFLPTGGVASAADTSEIQSLLGAARSQINEIMSHFKQEEAQLDNIKSAALSTNQLSSDITETSAGLEQCWSQLRELQSVDCASQSLHAYQAQLAHTHSTGLIDPLDSRFLHKAIANSAAGVISQ
jgi:hypothetical protein